MKTICVLLSLLSLASCNGGKNETPTTGQNLQNEQKTENVQKVEAPETTISEDPKNKENKEVKVVGVPELSLKRTVVFNPDFSNFDEFKNNLNKYNLHIERNNFNDELSLKCTTDSSMYGDVVYTKEFQENASNEDLLIDLSKTDDGKKIIRCMLSSANQKIIESKFEIAKDILISKSSELSELEISALNNEFGAFVMEGGVVLETMGSTLNLKVDQFIADDSTIASFDQEKNLKASNDSDGLSGGIININANTAYGYLLVKMVGQDGGDVTKGPKNRVDAAEFNTSLNGKPMLTKNEILDLGMYGRHNIEKVSQCPTDGLKGFRGPRGYNGFDGRLGGNSGVVSFNTLDGSAFHFKTKLNAGNGSLAGKIVGLGGRGSSGGNPGTYINNPNFFLICKNSMGTFVAPVAGANGDNGEPGDFGQNGKSGIKERAIYIDQKNNKRIEF
jgi:hypothetical protein